MPYRPFPRRLLRESKQTIELVGTVRIGGRTASGVVTTQRVDGGGLWTIALQDVEISRVEHVRDWRAITAYLAGGSRPIIMPICDKRHAPVSVVTRASVVAAARRATIMEIQVSDGSAISVGQHFSIAHTVLGHRLYRVTAVEANPILDEGGQPIVDEDGEPISSGWGTAAHSIAFEPPLREAIGAGAGLDFVEPKIIVQLADPTSMALTLDMRRLGRPSGQFVESFLPAPIAPF